MGSVLDASPPAVQREVYAEADGILYAVREGALDVLDVEAASMLATFAIGGHRPIVLAAPGRMVVVSRLLAQDFPAEEGDVSTQGVVATRITVLDTTDARHPRLFRTVDVDGWDGPAAVTGTRLVFPTDTSHHAPGRSRPKWFDRASPGTGRPLFGDEGGFGPALVVLDVARADAPVRAVRTTGHGPESALVADGRAWLDRSGVYDVRHASPEWIGPSVPLGAVATAYEGRVYAANAPSRVYVSGGDAPVSLYFEPTAVVGYGAKAAWVGTTLWAGHPDGDSVGDDVTSHLVAIDVRDPAGPRIARGTERARLGVPQPTARPGDAVTFELTVRTPATNRLPDPFVHLGGALTVWTPEGDELHRRASGRIDGDGLIESDAFDTPGTIAVAGERYAVPVSFRRDTPEGHSGNDVAWCGAVVLRERERTLVEDLRVSMGGACLADGGTSPEVTWVGTTLVVATDDAFAVVPAGGAEVRIPR